VSRNYYSEINPHLTWHTKASEPLLTPQVEPFVHRYLKQRLINTPGVYVHEIGGTENHFHVAISIKAMIENPESPAVWTRAHSNVIV
jgi:REP-associated tyrosine transposase